MLSTLFLMVLDLVYVHNPQLANMQSFKSEWSAAPSKWMQIASKLKLDNSTHLTNELFPC